MLGFLANLAGGAIAPLFDQMSEFAGRLLRKLALFILAALCLVVVSIALTLAFGLWIATLAGPIVGVLAVAGLYLLIAVVAVLLALKTPSRAITSDEKTTDGKTADSRVELDSQVDDFTAPLINILRTLGLRREQLAVFAGASVAKQLGPVPLVGLAIIAGFLIGRTFKSWRGLVSIDMITTLLASAGLFGFGNEQPDDAAPDAPDTKKAA